MGSADKSAGSGLNGRDLINIGIYTAIIFVLMMALAMTGLIPIMLMLLSSMCAIVCGIPFMLYLTKVKKFGMIVIMCTILGLVMFATGMSWVPIPFAFAVGLVAELVWKAGNYTSAKHAVLTCAVFSLWPIGNYLPLFFMRDTYWLSRASYGADYINAVNAMTPNWMLLVLVVVTFACGIIGGLLGKALLKKHFQKAGIA